MAQRFRDHIASLLVTPKKHRFLLGVSGGVDSVVLVHLVYSLQLDFGIAHVNYALRGAESDADEQLVRDLADSLGVACHVAQAPIAPDASGIQARARDLRYHWFREVLKSSAYDTILTAHHADDQLETFFMRLMRGSGLEGLGGIHEKNDILVRPLLPFFKAEILAYAKKEKLNWREDVSNSATKYLRNAIRQNVLPHFKELSADAAANTLMSMQHLRDAFEGIASQLQNIKAAWTKQGETFVIPLTSIGVLNPKSFWLHHLFAPYGFDVKEVEKLLKTHAGKKCTCDKYVLTRERDHLILAPIAPTVSTEQDYFLVSEKGIETPIELKISTVASTYKPTAKCVVFDKEKLDFPLILRRWKTADVFYPTGMTGKKKVAKFFKDEKMSAREKKQQWLLCSGDDVVWVVGKRINRKFEASANTNMLQITLV
jgi:tRNA(Ile)-lysidine synthase